MNNVDEFERHTRTVLEESVARLDGATRSRLTQARHRALDALAARDAATGWQRWFGGRGVLAPAGAAAAVVALTTVLWVNRPDSMRAPEMTAAAGSLEDMELLADVDALAAMSEEDPEFYEWALAQDASGDPAIGT